jgi:hypothetical protein
MPDPVHLLCGVDPQFEIQSTSQKYQGCKFAFVEKGILDVAFSSPSVIEE